MITDEDIVISYDKDRQIYTAELKLKPMTVIEYYKSLLDPSDLFLDSEKKLRKAVKKKVYNGIDEYIKKTIEILMKYENELEIEELLDFGEYLLEKMK